jgi:putative Mg2+ transporter-C (MgtC) family protein
MLNFISLYRVQLESLARLVLAMLLGAVIGLERELKDKPAGLRTHMLVAGASTLITVLGVLLIEYLNREVGSQLVESDPLRILGAVVTGVSFLGAGTILRRTRAGQTRTDQVEGLTTAASLLLSAALGMCAALSQWVLAIGVTLLALITLRGVAWLESRLWRCRD